MLNNLRNKFDPIIEKVGRGFASLGFGPSFWTWVGLGLSIISAIMFSLHSPAIGVDWYTATFLGSLFLLFAGFFDIVDGAVARVTKRTSALGGYLDSVLDKVSEIIIFIGILIGSFTNPVLVLVALSLSLLVSYTRARGEGLGVDLKGKGIAERAERVLIIVILGFIPFQENISVALWIISILAAVTVLERLKIVSTKFGTPLFSAQTFRDMSSRNHEYEASSGTITSRLNEPPTSLSKITKNVNDYLDKPDNKKMTTPDKSSKSSTTATSPTLHQQPLKLHHHHHHLHHQQPLKLHHHHHHLHHQQPLKLSFWIRLIQTKWVEMLLILFLTKKVRTRFIRNLQRVIRHQAHPVIQMEKIVIRHQAHPVIQMETSSDTASSSSGNTDGDNNKTTKLATTDEKKSENNQ